MRNPFEIIRLVLAFILLPHLAAVGQSLPDSIIIFKNTYINNFADNDILYQVEKSSIVYQKGKYILKGGKIDKATIQKLLFALQDENNTNNSLAKYEIDTNRIKTHPEEIFRLYNNEARIAWNEQQKEFILKKLSDPNNYINGLQNYLSAGCCNTTHNGYKYEYIIQLFANGKVTDEIKSRKSVGGYKMPWTNKSRDTLYNYDIESILSKILSTKEITDSPLKGNQLLEYLVRKIVSDNLRSLYRISAYSYKREIEELKTDFTIVSSEEEYGMGRYIWEPTIKIILKDSQTPDNVYLIFMASKQEKSIYSRDDIKRDYKEYIGRIRSITFINNYLKANPNSKLDIYYFNNKGINNYNIKNVNGDSISWASHDKWVEGLKWYETHNIKPSFDINESIETSKRTNCGCNYRFERSYIEKAIFFEIYDANGNTSIWLLMPDNTVLFYLMDSETALNFNRSDFNKTNKYGSIHPCVLFDANGNKVTK